MGKKAYLAIKETESELNSLLSKQRKVKNIDRLRSLLFIKRSTFSTRQELADALGYHIRTMERWLDKYKTGGMKAMLIPEVLERKSHIVTPELHQALKEQVEDAQKGFRTYVEAKDWVKANFDIDMTYHWIRAYLIQHFKTKIKRPRKSHVKKNDEAVEAFLKTS